MVSLYSCVVSSSSPSDAQARAGVISVNSMNAAITRDSHRFEPMENLLNRVSVDSLSRRLSVIRGAKAPSFPHGP